MTRGAKAQPLARKHPYDRVAFVGMAQKEMHGREFGLIGGLHRCQDANLVVVPDLAILHDMDALAADVDLFVSFLYIVFLGLDVVTKTQLAAAQGSPKRLEAKHCVRHVATQAQRVTFCVGRRLQIEHEDVHRALTRIARMPLSRFTVTKKPTSASGEISFDELRDVVAWACSARRVFNELGPKALVPNGLAIV